MQKDPIYAKLHAKYYRRFLDDLDADIVRVIMSNPDCEEARLLNDKTTKAVDAELNYQTLDIRA